MIKKHIADFLKLLKEEWIKAFVVVIVGISFAFLSEPIITTKNYILDMFLNYKDISRNESLAIANKYVGKKICYAIPFHNKNDNQQFILVITEYDYDENNVVLLKGKNEIYESKILNLVAYRENSHPSYCSHRIGKENESFGVTDIDNDGFKEIFSTSYSGGTGSWGINISSYDTKSSEYYSVHAEGTRGWHILEPDYSNNVDEKDNMRDLLLDLLELQTMGGTGKSSQMHSEINSWLMRNGRNFTIGKLKSKLNYSTLEETGWSSVSCEAKSKDSIWKVIFKGPIINTDLESKKFRLIYVPNDTTDMTGTLVVGQNYVWFPIRVKNRILAFDKLNNSIVGFAVEEWDKYSNDKHEYEKDSKGFRLTVSDGSLAVFRKKITVLDFEDLSLELVSAVVCK